MLLKKYSATILTPQGRDVQANPFKTNLQIERLVLEKRRLRRAWQTNRSPSSKQRLKEATRSLNRALKQETKKAQLQYIKKLSPTSTKHPLWRAHPNLSSPIETVTPIRNSSGSWVRSDEVRAENFALLLQYFPTTIVSAKGDRESHWGTETEKGPLR